MVASLRADTVLSVQGEPADADTDHVELSPVNSRSRPVPARDHLRLLGALIDILVSVVLVGAAIGVMALTLDSGADRSIVPPLLILLAFWALDVVVYALPIHKCGWSLGNVLTRRRVVERQTGGPLPFRGAVRRYFARRNVLRWLSDSRVAELELVNYRSVDHIIGPAAGSYALLVAPLGGVLGGAMYASMAPGDLAAQNWLPGDPNGPTASNADRRAGSAVVKSRPSAADLAPTPATQSRRPVDAVSAPRTRHGNRPDSRPSPSRSRPTPLRAPGSARTPGGPDQQ